MAFQGFGTSSFGTSQPQQPSIFGAAKPAQQGSLFGASQPQQQPSIFGQSQPQQQTQTPSLFGANQQQQQPQQQGSSLFGQPQQQTQQQQAQPSLFGQPQQQQSSLFASSQPQQQPSLFSTPQQQQQSSLFSTPQQQQQPQQSSIFGATSQQPQSGSLFGSQQPNSGSSLFSSGQTATSQQPQQSSLFSSTPQQAQPSTPFGTSSIFGQTPQQQQQQQQPSSLFNQTSQPSQTSSLFKPAGSLFQSQAPAANQSSFLGQSQQQVAPQQSSGGQNIISIQNSTVFEDFPEDVKKMFIEIENHIRSKVDILEELKAKTLGVEIEKAAKDLRELRKEFTTLSVLLDQSLNSSQDVKTNTQEDVQDAIQAIRILDASKTSGATAAGSSVSGGSAASAVWIQEYFERKLVAMQLRFTAYKRALEQVQEQLGQPESAHAVKMLVPTLQAQYSYAISLASKIAELQEDMDEIKLQYRVLLKEKHGITRNPFLESEREGAVVKGMEGVHLR